MIRIEHMTKSYPLAGFRRYYVYRDISLTLPERTNIGVIGRNGVGKSTLLRLIGGIEYPDSGRIEITGTVSPPGGLQRGFSGKLSGRDNATFVCRINGITGADMRDCLEFIEKFADIGEFFNRPVNTYSSGMRARLAFAVNMAFEFDYYLIDELGAVGDERFKQRARQAFEQKKGRASIINVSHNLGQLKAECQVGLYFSRNRVQYFDDIGDAIAAYQEEVRQSK